MRRRSRRRRQRSLPPASVGGFSDLNAGRDVVDDDVIVDDVDVADVSGVVDDVDVADVSGVVDNDVRVCGNDQGIELFSRRR